MQKIDISLKPSRLFIYLLMVILVGCLLCIFSLSVAWSLKIILIISVLFYGAWIFWKEIYLMSAASMVGLQLLEEESCYLRYFSSNTIAAEIDGSSTVTALVCVLRFKVPDQRRKTACVVFKDSVDKEMYRKLMVWLRCSKVEKKKNS